MSSIRSRAPAASSGAVRRIMQAVSGGDTQAERVLKGALFRRGLRFRKNCRPIENLRISADVVFPRERVCVFVDGCFWHGCPAHFHPPRANRQWWKEKVEDNRRRDRSQSLVLRKHGWQVVRVWEHEVLSNAIHRCACRIEECVRSRRRLTTGCSGRWILPQFGR